MFLYQYQCFLSFRLEGTALVLQVPARSTVLAEVGSHSSLSEHIAVTLRAPVGVGTAQASLLLSSAQTTVAFEALALVGKALGANYCHGKFVFST